MTDCRPHDRTRLEDRWLKSGSPRQVHIDWYGTPAYRASDRTQEKILGARWQSRETVP